MLAVDLVFMKCEFLLRSTANLNLTKLLTFADKEEVFDSCGFCKQIPVMPYLGACKIHAYCYYCVSTALQKDEGLKCPLCAVVIEAISPLHCSSITLS